MTRSRTLQNKSTKSGRGRPTKAKQTTPTVRVSSRNNKGVHPARPTNNNRPMPQDVNPSVHSGADRHSYHNYSDSDDDMAGQPGPSLPGSADLESRLEAHVQAQDAHAQAQDARFDRLEALIANALAPPHPQVPTQTPLPQPQHSHASTSQTMTPPSKNTGNSRYSTSSRDACSTHSHSSSIHVKKLQTQLKRDVRSALSSSTQKAYKSEWSRFSEFMTNVIHCPAHMATTEHVELYVVHLHNENLRSKTIRSNLSALSFQFQSSNQPTPTESFNIDKLLVAYAKTDPPPTIRLPISKVILAQLIAAINRQPNSHHDKIMFRSLYSHSCTMPYSA